MIQVLEPGLLTTLQDLGREGYGPIGVSPSGAADPIALRLGNRLTGNAENAAALEMTLLGGAFLFEQDAVVAVAGSDFGVAPWRTYEIEAGRAIRFGSSRSGARCYLCVRGGIEVPPFLGSASTHLLSGLGGMEGRPLRKGDVLKVGREPLGGTRAEIEAGMTGRLAPRKELRVTRGPAWDPAILTSPYRVTEDSNRTGLRLQGLPLRTAMQGRMITEGVPLGAIQVPAGGQPIILFVEQQTTGGYPKAANVISADLPFLGQLRPRDEIGFELVSPERARSLIREQEEWLSNLL